jgi:uncharacterized protein YndB with AHSA1/START domain
MFINHLAEYLVVGDSSESGDHKVKLNSKKMEPLHKKSIIIETKINAPVEKVWSCWTHPEHITKWCQASDDWYAPYADNDLRVNGKFNTTMAARDGSASFEFEGIYTDVLLFKLLSYTLHDGRKVTISFSGMDRITKVVETFEPENMNSAELQRDGWQSILNNFKRYVEGSGKLERLHFETYINAPADKVFHKMLDKESYGQWTSVFAPGSCYKGSWNKGSKILFLGMGENGKMGGMVSRIKENIHSRFVSIEHVGLVQDGKEVTTGKDAEAWAGAYENYIFREQNEGTMLSIDTEVNRDFKDLFTETWPAGLEKLKAICEE